MSIGAAVVLSAVVLGLTAALVLALHGVERAADAAEQSAEVVDLHDDLERAVREFQRRSNNFIATRWPDVEAARSSARAEAEALLARLAVAVGEEGAPAVERLTAIFQRFVAARAELEARGANLEETVRESRPLLEAFLELSEELRGRCAAEQRESDRLLAHEIRLLEVAAIGVAAVATTLLVVAALVLARWVVGPILGMRAAVGRFRGGDDDARAPGSPLREVDELAAGFNDLIQTITRQRRDQLTYLAGVAHDLRTPLTGIRLGVQALERGVKPPGPESFRRLERQVDRLARMVGDLLEATRIEAGQFDVRPVEVDLRQPARAIVDLYAATSERHEVTLDAPAEPVLVTADPLRLEQVISNLVSNAIKFSPAGGRVEVSVERRGDDGAVVVRDHGVGIPADELEDIFLPFRRREATADLAQGAGLGLSIVRRIVRALGGSVDVESTPGAGSTFRVLLPAARSASVSGGQP